jgi:nucleoside-diphosphate-sugar epimerase
MKMLITGINGFVGQNLRPYLANDFDIHCISRHGKIGGFTYAQFFNETIGYDALVHLAGKAHDLKKTAEDSQYYEVNYELTKRLFDRFLASEAKTFIYISSVKAVADIVEGVLTEEVVPSPVTAYGKSKILAEEYILAHLPKDKKVYILRPCMIHGPGNKGNLNLLFGLVRKGFPWPLGAFENQRSFLSVENLCFVIRELLVQENIASGVYNVADDVSLSTNELIAVIGISQKKHPRIVSVPKKLIGGLARVGDVLQLPLSTERLQKLTESYVVSNAKIVTAIGKPLPVDSKEGLVRTMESFEGRG